MPSPTPPTRRRRAASAAGALALLLAALALAGCSTGHPGLISHGDLAEAQTFPYYRVYWAGRHFQGQPLAAVDGVKSYLPNVGDSVYYGDCVQKKGIFGGGSCTLPLQITTLVYRLHSNKALGPQRNILVRGVPAVVYDEGRSIEVYTGRLAIDIFSDTFAHGLAAAQQMLPVNAPGAPGSKLALPVYCPILFGPEEAAVERVMQNLPRHACQQAAGTVAFTKAVRGE